MFQALVGDVVGWLEGLGLGFGFLGVVWRGTVGRVCSICDCSVRPWFFSMKLGLMIVLLFTCRHAPPESLFMFRLDS